MYIIVEHNKKSLERRLYDYSFLFRTIVCVCVSSVESEPANNLIIWAPSGLTIFLD